MKKPDIEQNKKYYARTYLKPYDFDGSEDDDRSPDISRIHDDNTETFDNLYDATKGNAMMEQVTERPWYTQEKMPFYGFEWEQIKEFRKKWKKILKEIITCCPSYPMADFGKVLEKAENILKHAMHLKETSAEYGEYLNIFIEMIESTGTLVGFENNGKGVEPLLLSFMENEEVDGSTVETLLGKHRARYLNQWYAWASQWWLPDEHAKWYGSLHRMSRSNDTDAVHRKTKIILLDETSLGAAKYAKFVIKRVNMVSLELVLNFENWDPWWIPPENGIRLPKFTKKVKVPEQSDRLKIIQSYLLVLKQKINAGALAGGNAILFTSSADLVGFCIYKNIDLYIDSVAAPSTSIRSVREQIMAMRGLLGYATRWVKEETRVLSFLVLMLISLSHGLPLYISIGWEKVFSEWSYIVKENKRQITPENADRDCMWLARVGGGTQRNIILNQSLITLLFVRLLNKAFTPDKKISSGDGGDGYMKYLTKYYTEMKEENRVGSGRVKPACVGSDWYASHYGELDNENDFNSTGRPDTNDWSEVDDFLKDVSDDVGPPPGLPERIRKEWMYAQRLHFTEKYYAPRDLDHLMTIFRIRFKDWTSESIISINV
jgi:hypothetical protein